jgi:hypothetical protein
MSEETNSREYGLVTTTNSLKDLIDWLKLGHNVYLTSRFGQRIFMGKDDAQNEYTKVIVHITCAKMPDLLCDGEWNHYIEEAGFTECKITSENKDEIKKIMNRREVISFNV